MADIFLRKAPGTSPAARTRMSSTHRTHVASAAMEPGQSDRLAQLQSIAASLLRMGMPPAGALLPLQPLPPLPFLTTTVKQEPQPPLVSSAPAASEPNGWSCAMMNRAIIQPVQRFLPKHQHGRRTRTCASSAATRSTRRPRFEALRDAIPALPLVKSARYNSQIFTARCSLSGTCRCTPGRAPSRARAAASRSRRMRLSCCS